jgi:UDP-N-acetyl-D-glucosamine dehydrogenase
MSEHKSRHTATKWRRTLQTVLDDLPLCRDDETQSPLDANLIAAIERRSAVIGIIGLGYVGIPLALAAVSSGFKVVGFDIDSEKVEKLNRRQSFIRHISDEAISRAISSGKLHATSDMMRLREADAIVICVPTPLTRHREPDLSFICETTKHIARILRRGQLIVLESTTYPGTTEEIVKPILEQTGLRSGSDFFLAFSPEREDPGSGFATTAIPKVVGGDGQTALMLVENLYSQFVATTVPVSSPSVAEAVKLTENIFRSVNIALVNELKIVYGAMGIDIWEIIRAAKTKPFGFMAFYPGPGLGGHCIPIDPFYLTWKAREYDVPTRFIELAGEINACMPNYVLKALADALDQHCRRGLNGARLLLLGIAYKKNVDDLRESPALKLIELAEKKGATCDYHDQFIQIIPKTREHGDLAGRESVQLSERVLASYDAVLIATDHDNVDYRMVASCAPLIVDTRDACGRAGLSAPNIIKA